MSPEERSIEKDPKSVQDIDRLEMQICALSHDVLDGGENAAARRAFHDRIRKVAVEGFGTCQGG
jgi:hypothetical protein